jgi:hypothetical protein
MTQVRSFVFLDAGATDGKPKQPTIRWDYLEAPTTKATAGLIVTVHRLISTEGHLP